MTRRNDPVQVYDLQKWIDGSEKSALILPFNSSIARGTSRLLKQ